MAVVRSLDAAHVAFIEAFQPRENDADYVHVVSDEPDVPLQTVSDVNLARATVSDGIPASGLDVGDVGDVVLPASGFDGFGDVAAAQDVGDVVLPAPAHPVLGDWRWRPLRRRPPMFRRRHTTIYQYENSQWPGQIAILWECDGEVSFQSARTVSRWHGHFRVGADRSLDIAFDCRGGIPKSHVLQFAALDFEGRRTWQGFDYMARRILMTRIGYLEWDPVSETWEDIF